MTSIFGNYTLCKLDIACIETGRSGNFMFQTRPNIDKLALIPKLNSLYSPIKLARAEELSSVNMSVIQHMGVGSGAQGPWPCPPVFSRNNINSMTTFNRK